MKERKFEDDEVLYLRAAALSSWRSAYPRPFVGYISGCDFAFGLTGHGRQDPAQFGVLVA